MAKATSLNDTKIKQTKPAEKVITLSDGGLQLCIKPNGSMLWKLRFTKPIDKKPALMTLGHIHLLRLYEPVSCVNHLFLEHF